MEPVPQPEKLIHLYDELSGAQLGIRTEAYRKHLIKWGVDESTASRLCSQLDPSGKGAITRAALCETLKCWPNQPAILKHVKLIDSDMPAMKRDSVILLILEVVVENKSKKATIDEIKQRLEKIYGRGWSCYIAEGRYWSVCSHRQGTNLAFVYKDMVYGVYQTPNAQ